MKTFQLMLAHHGLSLTDHYWMKEYEDELDWEHVNLYTNDFQVLYTLDLSDDKKEDQPYVPSERSLLDIRVTSFLSREADLLRYVKNRGIIKAELLPDGNDLYRLLGEDEMTAGETNEKIVKAYEGKIKLLTDFQNGADIWSYKYQKGFR